MMSVFYIIIIILYFLAECFQAQALSPSCSRAAISSICSGIDNPNDLTKVFSESNKDRTLPLKFVSIEDSDFSYIPYDLFQDQVKIDEIRIRRSTLISISDTDAAFKGLEKGLRYFRMYDSVLFMDFEWNKLRTLTALKTVELNNIGLEYVDSDVSAVSSIVFLFLINNEISYISDQAFASLVHIWGIDLGNNKISEVKRSMFPNPANELTTLKLRDNQISTLPLDFFTSMPKLFEVDLSNNKLLTVEQAVFKPIWRSNLKLDLSGNSLRCDCRMKWLLDQPIPRSAYGACEQPRELNKRNITTLSKSELWCF